MGRNQLLRNTFRGFSRVPGPGHGPAQNKQRRAVFNGVKRRGDPLLVMRRASGKTYAGSDYLKGFRQMGFNKRKIGGGADDAVEPGPHRAIGKVADIVGDAVRHQKFFL